jgi:hypothetical protein
MAVTYVGGLHRGRNLVGMLKKLVRASGNDKVFGGFCTKAGIPTNDSDIANNNGDICWDTTNDDLYIASNVVEDSTTTWTKFVGV